MPALPDPDGSLERPPRDPPERLPGEDGKVPGLLEPPRFWAVAFWITVAAAAAVVLFAVAFRPRGLLTAVELRSERGNEQKGMLILSPGERLRLEVQLGSPSAVMVILEDPKGAISELHPPPGDVPLVSGPVLSLPEGARGSWSSDDLEPGLHFLWILAAAGKISGAERSRLRSRAEEALGRMPAAGEGRRRAPKVLLEALKPEIREIALRPFWVHGKM